MLLYCFFGSWMEKISKLCSAASHLNFNTKGYVQHIQLFHAHQANFRVTCGINGCQRTYTNFGTFSQHVYAMHYQAVCCIQSESSRRNLSSFDDDGSDDESGHTEDVDQSSYSVQIARQ